MNLSCSLPEKIYLIYTCKTSLLTLKILDMDQISYNYSLGVCSLGNIDYVKSGHPLLPPPDFISTLRDNLSLGVLDMRIPHGQGRTV